MFDLIVLVAAPLPMFSQKHWSVQLLLLLTNRRHVVYTHVSLPCHKSKLFDRPLIDQHLLTSCLQFQLAIGFQTRCRFPAILVCLESLLVLCLPPHSQYGQNQLPFVTRLKLLVELSSQPSRFVRLLQLRSLSSTILSAFSIRLVCSFLVRFFTEEKQRDFEWLHSPPRNSLKHNCLSICWWRECRLPHYCMEFTQ